MTPNRLCHFTSQSEPPVSTVLSKPQASLAPRRRSAHALLALCGRTYPANPTIRRRTSHRLPSANSIVSRAVFFASPR